MTLLVLKVGALAAAALMLLATTLGPQLVVVDVRDGGPGGHRILVPVPLVVLRAGAALVPDDVAPVDEPELRRIAPAAARFMQELEGVSDGELVRVEERSTRVSVRKLGDELHVEVLDGEDEVRVKVPIEAVVEILERAREDELDAGDALTLLGSASRGDLVYVSSGDDVVKVKVW